MIQAQSLNAQAYDLLKQKILSNQIQPGCRLVDSQLAEEFGISRTPVRDAIRKLTEEGLVVTDPGKKGYFVYQPSAQDIREIYEIRRILELSAAEKLISELLPINPGLLDPLLSYIQAPASDSIGFPLYDAQFHRTMVELCGNSRIMEIYDQIGTYLQVFRSKTAQDPSRNKQATACHQQILHGLRTLDLAKTQDAIRTHIRLSEAHTMQEYLLGI